MSLGDYIHNKPVIETGRLILRPLVFSDIMAFKSHYGYRGKASREDDHAQAYLLI